MAKAIMIQGTMSSAGKSLIATALCRIFKQDGYRVAPFKAQNIALNSYITKNGLEMGRAQVVQAEAAGVEPDVNMNPILLKPTKDMGTQVVLNGKVHSNMNAFNYMEEKQIFMSEVMKAYNTLAEQYDIIVLEGAGSPSEININSDDIVNMGMAKKAKAPVILVGDIDKGGVFASLYGTVMLLDPEERNYIKATVVNKFRGDIKYFESGTQLLEQTTGVPVAGVIPYLEVDIDDEDSVSERLQNNKQQVMKNITIDIAIIHLPHLSNFTDFNTFERMNGVSVRYVKSASQLNNPDMIIIPGTKNTMSDLEWLRQNGIDTVIKKQAEKGTVIFGICGGYQMLGENLNDPCVVEHGGKMMGLGLLPLTTVFEVEKTTTQIEGNFRKISGVLAPLEGMNFKGYEIHMGQSERISGDALVNIQRCSENRINGRTIDKCNDETEDMADYKTSENLNLNSNKASGSMGTDGCCYGNIYGSYVHGIFDESDVVAKIVECLIIARGLEHSQLKLGHQIGLNTAQYKDQQYDILAASVRQNLDMDLIYRILDEGV